MRTVLAMIIGLHCLLWPTAVIAQSSDLERLQAAYEGLNQARTSRDADALAAAVDDRAVFFEKRGLLDQDIEEGGKSSFREGLKEAFDQIERYESKAINAKYRLFGSTGIVWADTSRFFTGAAGETTSGRALCTSSRNPGTDGSSWPHFAILANECSQFEQEFLSRG